MKISNLKAMLIAATLLALSLAGTASATGLTIHFRDAEGNPVNISKAELLLVAWGDTKRLDLGRGTDSLTVNMDEDWLKEKWARFADMENAYLLLQADGYAPRRSDGFRWIGSGGAPYGGRVTEARVVFPLGREVSGVVVKEGEDAALTLDFRRPVDRYLKFVDEEGVPVKDVKVTSRLYWSSSNHCGYLAGADPMDEDISDEDGRVGVPDGDIEYAFEISKHPYVLESPGNRYFPQRLVTYLYDEEMTVELHRQARGTLRQRALKDGEPLAGKVLFGTLAACPCGACSGPLSRGLTDEDGVIVIPEFYPEKFDSVFIMDDEGEKPVWKWTPSLHPEAGSTDGEVHWTPGD